MISITDIRNILGESSKDLGTLCRSDNINKWSWHKPINSHTLKKTTDTDRFSDNDGFDLSTYFVTTTLYVKNRFESSTGIEWQYHKRNKPFRMGDFISYDPSASRWFDVSADVSTVGIGEGDISSFNVTWANGRSYIPEVFQFDFCQDSSIDSFGYVCWFSNTSWPYYYHKGLIQEYNGSGQIYPYNTSSISITDFPLDSTGTIIPVMAHTNRQGVSDRLYTYSDAQSRNFKFLCLESNYIPIRINSAANMMFENIQVIVYWDQGSISGQYKSFRGAVWLRNRNQQNVSCRLLIYNANTDLSDPDIGADTIMYDNSITLEASPDGETWSFLEIMSGEMTNTEWTELTPSDFAMFYIDLSINNKHITLTPTADTLPKTLTYNLSDYTY